MLEHKKVLYSNVVGHRKADVSKLTPFVRVNIG